MSISIGVYFDLTSLSDEINLVLKKSKIDICEENFIKVLKSKITSFFISNGHTIKSYEPFNYTKLVSRNLDKILFEIHCSFINIDDVEINIYGNLAQLQIKTGREAER